jgi:hypothetical protein
MDAANSSEPIGRGRVCQSNPSRGIPIPPNLMWTFGHSAKTGRFSLRSVSLVVGDHLPL